MSDLVLDPNKLYAELAPYTNLVAWVFRGETIPGWAMYPGRKIVEVPEDVVVHAGYRYYKGVFTPPPAAPTFDERAVAEVDSPFYRLLFDINFDQESRLRTIEGRPTITKVQYRDALIARWKELNS